MECLFYEIQDKVEHCLNQYFVFKNFNTKLGKTPELLLTVHFTFWRNLRRSRGKPGTLFLVSKCKTTPSNFLNQYLFYIFCKNRGKADQYLPILDTSFCVITAIHPPPDPQTVYRAGRVEGMLRLDIPPVNLGYDQVLAGGGGIDPGDATAIAGGEAFVVADARHR